MDTKTQCLVLDATFTPHKYPRGRHWLRVRYLVCIYQSLHVCDCLDDNNPSTDKCKTDYALALGVQEALYFLNI